MLHGSHHLRAHNVPLHRHIRHRSWAVLAIIVAPVIILVAAGALVGINWGVLVSALGMSLYRLIAAYLIALVVGVLLGIGVTRSRYVDYLLPVFDVLQNVPSFALIPVFVLLMGYSSTMIIVFTATSVVWPIFFYLVSAIRTARHDLVDAATVFGAQGWKRVRHFLLPLAFPALVTGSLVGISIGWEAVIGVEIIGATMGIGTFLNDAGAAHNNATLLVGIVAILVVVFVVNRLVWAPLIARTHLYAE